MDYCQYIIIFVFAFVVELIYIPLAARLKIGSVPTIRSSHNSFQITGGGIIFILVAGLFALIHHSDLTQGFETMLIASAILALVSYIDDIKDLSPSLRLIVQLLAVAFAFNQLLFDGSYNFYLIVVLAGVGVINVYNFMDGVNGMMAVNSIVIMATLCFGLYINDIGSGIDSQFTLAMLITSVVLAFFNLRKRAKVFAGDVGSIVVGFFIVYLIVNYIIATSEASCIVFLAVYLVDDGFTIIQRLFIGENIFTSHRRHLYQIMTNQWEKQHYAVALAYGGVQLLINAIYFAIPGAFRWSYVIVVFILLTATYFSFKHAAIKEK